MTAGGERVANSWDWWLFPARSKLDGSEVFVAAKCMDCHDGPVLGARKVMRVAPARPDRPLKVPALRGLRLRKAYLTEGKVNDLDAVVPKMPGGDLSPEDRKALVDFLKTL